MTGLRCSAKTSSGRSCSNWAIRGGTVCKVHGGSAPQVRAAANRRLERARVNGELGDLLADVNAATPEEHPIETALDAVRRASVMVRALSVMLAELDTPLGRNRHGEDVIHPIAALYAEWVGFQAKASQMALAAGVDERRIQLAEREAQPYLDLFLAAITEAGLDTDAEVRLKTAIGRLAREMQGTPTIEAASRTA